QRDRISAETGWRAASRRRRWKEGGVGQKEENEKTTARLRDFRPPLLRRLHPAAVARVDEAAGLAPPQRGVMAAPAQQFVVAAGFDDAGAVEHDETVHLGDGRESVRDGDHRAAGHPRAY